MKIILILLLSTSVLLASDRLSLMEQKDIIDSALNDTIRKSELKKITKQDRKQIRNIVNEGIAYLEAFQSDIRSDFSTFFDSFKSKPKIIRYMFSEHYCRATDPYLYFLKSLKCNIDYYFSNKSFEDYHQKSITYEVAANFISLLKVIELESKSSKNDLSHEYFEFLSNVKDIFNQLFEYFPISMKKFDGFKKSPHIPPELSNTNFYKLSSLYKDFGLTFNQFYGKYCLNIKVCKDDFDLSFKKIWDSIKEEVNFLASPIDPTYIEKTDLKNEKKNIRFSISSEEQKDKIFSVIKNIIEKKCETNEIKISNEKFENITIESESVQAERIQKEQLFSEFSLEFMEFLQDSIFGKGQSKLTWNQLIDSFQKAGFKIRKHSKDQKGNGVARQFIFSDGRRFTVDKIRGKGALNAPLPYSYLSFVKSGLIQCFDLTEDLINEILKSRK